MESGVDDAASGGIIYSKYVTDGGFSPGKTSISEDVKIYCYDFRN
jgi:hypothetical protein